MSNTSAGLLMCRFCDGEMEFLLVHPGGPLWKKKDAGAWTIPKGLIGDGEEPLAAAKREFFEELGFEASGNFLALTPVKQKGGKLVQAWAFAGDCDPRQVKSNTFSMEWPPRSGRMASFPEIDQAAFFRFEAAKAKINSAQIPLLEETRQKMRF